MKLIDVRKLWDKARHNAFTDLIRFRGRWYCVFREGETHVSADGALRLLESPDGRDWTTAALVTLPDADLRDPKLAIAPDGKLMLNAAKVVQDATGSRWQSVVWYSDDPTRWAGCHEVGEPGFWLWRHTWHRGVAYAVGYEVAHESFVKLYRSRDGRDYVPLVEHFCDVGEPSESSLVFAADTAYCLLRRDGKPNDAGLLGIAQPPYTSWQWRDLGVRIGAPQMLRLGDGRLVAGVRLHGSSREDVRTSLCSIDPMDGKLTELLALPSGGDTSYPGLAEDDGVLWVSYYSSHEERTAIYLARVAIDA